MASKNTTHVKKKKRTDPSFSKVKPLAYMPVQKKIYLSAVSGATQYGLVDAGRILSTSNHRLYRYGKKYEMKVDLDVAAVGAGDSVTVWALADSWAVQKAYEEAKRVFDKAYINERENLGTDARARWFDFRATIGVSGDTMFATVSSDPTGANTLLTGGEFDSSIVEDNAGVTRFFSWNPVTTASVYSIPAEYDLSGNTNTSPTTPTGSGPYADLQADSSPVEMEALQQRGNLPPYEANAFPAVWVKIATLQTSATEGAQRLSSGYFDAPCGQVVLQVAGASTVETLSNKVSVEFRAGDYKGVRAHNMERLA